MKILPRILFCCLFVPALPAFAEVRSKWIRIEQGGAVADDQGGFHLLQIIGNTSEQPLWVTVRQGEGMACVVTSKIEPKQSATFNCDLADLKPGEVPVAIDIFADEAQTRSLETIRDAMHFKRGDARTLRELASAQRLPVTFAGVAFSEKLGIGAALRFYFPHSNGKLVISESDIQYANGKQAVTIPLTSVRDLRVTETNRNAPLPWIIVAYEAAGQAKRACFQALDHPEDVNRIAVSLQVALSGAKDGTEDVPGETLGGAGLRRDTVHTILESEKVLAPDCASPKVVDTKVVAELANAAVKDGRPVSGDWSESWVIDRCGTHVTYGVSYQTDPKGGTFVAIKQP
jgi:hypothetical protein